MRDIAMLAAGAVLMLFAQFVVVVGTLAVLWRNHIRELL